MLRENTKDPYQLVVGEEQESEVNDLQRVGGSGETAAVGTNEYRG